MKKKLTAVSTMFILIILLNLPAYSANESFASIASGNWNSLSTWQMSTDGGSTWIPATKTPTDSSGTITIQSPHTVTVTANVKADQLIVNTGGTISINNLIKLTIVDGSGIDLVLNSGGTISGSGILQTQGADAWLDVRSGSIFTAALNINTGTTRASAVTGTAVLNGAVTVDSGATFHIEDGHTIQINNTVANAGSITGSSSTLIMKGSAFTNSGSITNSNLHFDTTTSISGSGNYHCADIIINSPGNVSLSGNVTFSPVSSFTINGGAMLTLNNFMITFTSGNLIFNNGAIVSSPGIFRTQGTVNMDIKNGSGFNPALEVNTGTTKVYSSSGPAVLNGSITVVAGATLQEGVGGYTLISKGDIINYGTITGSASTFIMRGSSLFNSSAIIATTLEFDSTTSYSGTGGCGSVNIVIGSTGNVTLTSSASISLYQSFIINSGGVFNLNSHNLSITNGTFILNSGATVSNSGTFYSQGPMTLDIKNGSSFNTALVANNGTTIISGSLYGTANLNGTLIVDTNAVFQVAPGGLNAIVKGNITNYGNINGSTSTLTARGSSLINNGSVNAITLILDTTTSLSGTGAFTSLNVLIAGAGNISLLNDFSFSIYQTFDVYPGCTLNPNTRTITIAGGKFTLYGHSTISNSGIFKTQGTLILDVKDSSAFNAPLKVNTGMTTTTSNANVVLYGPMTVDSGATLKVADVITLVQCSNVLNNGSIVGSGTNFILNGNDMTNNGFINGGFYFNTGIHTLKGTGTWGTTPIIYNGAVVTLTGNHQMRDININSGGIFNLSGFKLSVSGSNPIINNGTFTASPGAVEYDGVFNQSISTTNIIYNKLRINNSAGTVLPGAVTVNDTLSVILGHLNLNGSILTISPAGYLVETGSNTINGTSGYITTTRNLNAPSALNVGGLGAELTTASNLGVTEIRRGHAIQNNLSGTTSIQRYFDIIPATNSGLNATLSFHYDDSELNGKPETALSLFRSTNSGSSWIARGGTVNTSGNMITLNSIDAFSRWSATSPSPVACQIKLAIEGFYNTVTNRLNMKDTVRAYLRNSASPFEIVDSAKSIIDSVTFNGSFLFPNAVSGNYYIQLKHRNFLETWSKSGGESYTLGAALNYDFTTDSAKAFGNNMKKSGTKWVTYEGDVTQDGIVNLADEILVFNDEAVFASGYVKTDLNGDRAVNLTDFLISYNNVIGYAAKMTP